MWGHEHLDITDFCHKIKKAGYDGIDTWIPEEPLAKQQLLDAISREGLLLISHQHQAHGGTFDAFKASFLHYLELSCAGNPVMINSHSGKDYFTLEQNLALIDMAADFSERKRILVSHETHRGRIGYSPAVMKDYFKARPDMPVTADLSHWVCVSESFLENFSDVLEQALAAARHIHARVGFEEGPQIPDPRAPEWKYAVDHFAGWWDRIVEYRRKAGTASLGITTEFGPPPYMPMIPYVKKPVADQFDINCYMKDLLRERYR